LLTPHEAQLDLDSPYDSLWWETRGAIVWKSNHSIWGLLNGYWQATTGTRWHVRQGLPIIPLYPFFATRILENKQRGPSASIQRHLAM
jgi:hypothetical protein